jgi:hypothetical protein
MADRIEVQHLPPGIAKGSTLYNWQFGGGDPYHLPGDLGTANRLANGNLRPYETAILDVVLSQDSPISQRQLESIVSARMGATRGQVYPGAQRLAQHGSISRKKIRGQWHYARPGYSFLAAAKSAEGAQDV